MNVCVFGLWHLGCVTASSLADLGFNVKGLDFDDKTISNLKKGVPPLFEPGLEESIKKNISDNRLSFSSDPKIALSDIEVLWVTFDTPVDDNDIADVGLVKDNIISIMKHIPDKTRVIISSQLPVGSTREIKEIFEKEYPSKKIFFGYSPENLRLGNALKIFKNPDRIIMGVNGKEEEKEYMPILLKISERIEWMRIESAEMTKHAINSFLAMSITFANELASICESTGADAKEVERGLKTEERIGPKARLGPGAAFAGGTLARDINFLIEKSHEYNKKITLIKSIKDSNDYHKGWVKRKSLEIYGDVNGVKFGVLGLTYKPETDTLRRSLSVELCEWLHEQNGVVNAYDPHIKELPEGLAEKITLRKDAHELLEESECIIIATEHKLLKSIYGDNKELFMNKVVIDPNGFIENELPADKDFKYICVGRM